MAQKSRIARCVHDALLTRAPRACAPSAGGPEAVRCGWVRGLGSCPRPPLAVSMGRF